LWKPRVVFAALLPVLGAMRGQQLVALGAEGLPVVVRAGAWSGGRGERSGARDAATSASAQGNMAWMRSVALRA
jgi:hypothetical protein